MGWAGWAGGIERRARTSGCVRSFFFGWGGGGLGVGEGGGGGVGLGFTEEGPLLKKNISPVLTIFRKNI